MTYRINMFFKRKKQTKQWFIYLFVGWITLTLGLFFAIVIGESIERFFPLWENAKEIIQAVVMSFLVLPFTLYLYKKFFATNKKISYLFSQPSKILIGFLFPVILSFFSLFVMAELNWITLEKWNVSWQWMSIFFLNIGIAFLYEALPEEIIMRGFIYDVLRQKLSILGSVVVQSIIFLAFSSGNTLLLILTGLASTDKFLELPAELFLHFFFAISLALMRIYTDSLWSSIGFHLGYLVMARFLIYPDAYSVVAIVSYRNNLAQELGEIVLVFAIIIGTVGVLLMLLIIKRFKEKILFNKKFLN